MVLSDEQIKSRISELPLWKVEEGQLVKYFQLTDFLSALSLVNKSGEIAEQMNHHPDILIFGWNKVKFMISTHDAGGITDKDFELAKKIENIKV